jgi:soluble lytic murein transglycosylase
MGLLRALRSQRAGNDISAEALYLLAQAQDALGDLRQAHSLHQELRRAAPLSPWAAAARREVKRLRERDSQLLDLTAREALLAEADLLLQEQQYQEAERVYRRLLDQLPSGNLRPSLLMGLANVYRSARKREQAIPFLAEIVQSYPESPEAPAALYRIAVTYWNQDDNGQALAHFTQLKERYRRSSFVDSARFAIARIYESLGRPSDALALYRELAKQSSDKQLREQGEWRAAWIHYLQAEFDRAHAAFKRLATDRDGGRYKTAALFWQARAADRMSRAEEAKKIFLQILNEPDESYYKVPAARWLEKMGIVAEEKKAADFKPAAETNPPLSAEQSFHLARAQELARLTLNPLAVAELDEVKNLGGEETSLHLMLMREYARNGAYGRSVALANQFPRSSEELVQYRYPLAYWETIQKLAAERDLDPYLVVALIRQESLFDPKAISPASALGLMQLLPSTAIRVATQLGLPPPTHEKVFEPDLNLRLGTHHLKELFQRYANNVVKAIAAYNAGENAVARWEKQINAADEDEFIERIPYAETRLYVKLVLRNLRVYRKVYPDPKKEPRQE